MRAVSKWEDGRIMSTNYLVEISINDYLKLIALCVGKNEFQRKRVAASRTIYSLLRKDLQRGCVIPPIVLACSTHYGSSNLDDFPAYLEQSANSIVILDGLQRTHTIIDLVRDLERNNDTDALERLRASIIRIEVYVGLNKIGILYRMLTLNTGQTPMSLRHQIEILYLDYLSQPIDGIQLIRESDDGRAVRPNEYNFKDVIDGFNSYLDRNELPFDREDLLENIASLEKLADENQNVDLFRDFIVLFHAFIHKVASDNTDTLPDNFIVKEPFGRTVNSVLKRPQVMAGFGCALGKLKDNNSVSELTDIRSRIESIKDYDAIDFLERINTDLNLIKENSKKIGNAQRSFFQFFFRELFNPESDGYLDMSASSGNAYRKFKSQY